MPAPVMREESVDELVRDAVFLQQSAWPQHALRGRPAAERPVRLACDGPKVSQALTNLLQNSINALVGRRARRTPRRDHRPRAARATRAVLIEVEDNGPGFPSDRERLFEPYVTTAGQGDRLGPCHRQEDHGGTRRLG